MLDYKDLLKNKKEYTRKLKTRGFDLSNIVEQIENLVKKIKEIQAIVEPLQHKRNITSSKIGSLIKKNNKEEDIETLKEDVNKINKKIEKHKENLRFLKIELKKMMFEIPNVPRETSPIGLTTKENKVKKEYNKSNIIKHKIIPHYEIGIKKGIIDFERGRKVSGSRYNFLVGKGAILYNAIIQFMLEEQQKNGFLLIQSPIIVNSNALIGTGQLPKFESDLYKIEGEDKYLIPTSEVTLTNIYANEIIDEDKLNMSFVTITPCFRSEAGAAGKDTKGMIRMHQFNKVELVKLVKAKDDEKEFIHLLESAKSILEKLSLPYREVILCTGDMGFSSSFTIDLEVWLPSENAYREISSVSMFDNYQTRRMNIKTIVNGKKELLYTQNASGLAVDRTFVAILENYQTPNGDVIVPQELIKYTNFTRI